MQKNSNVKIRSYGKFAFACNNSYEGEWIQIPGSPAKTFRQEKADCNHREWNVYQVEVPVNDNYIDYIYEVEVNPVKGYSFFEAPYELDEKSSLDRVKRLNYHFKNIKKGDQVPLEYILWQWVHKNAYAIQQGRFSLIVTKNNFHVIQWLLQALYNDTVKEFCELDSRVVERLYMQLKGEKALIKLPTSEINSTIGEFDILQSNKELFVQQEQELRRKIEEQQKLLEALSNTNKSAEFKMQPTTADDQGQTQVPDLNQSLEDFADQIIDKEDLAEIVNRAVDTGVLAKKGAYYALEGLDKNFGPGVAKAIEAFKLDPSAKSLLKEALLKQEIVA